MHALGENEKVKTCGCIATSRGEKGNKNANRLVRSRLSLGRRLRRSICTGWLSTRREANDGKLHGRKSAVNCGPFNYPIRSHKGRNLRLGLIDPLAACFCRISHFELSSFGSSARLLAVYRKLPHDEIYLANVWTMKTPSFLIDLLRAIGKVLVFYLPVFPRFYFHD